MAYFGTTAAATAANPPQLVFPAQGGARTILGTTNLSAWSSGVTRAGGVQLWRYISTNVTTDLTSTGFFSDGYQLGMQIGDILIATQYTSAGSAFTSILGVLLTSNTTGGWNLSTGGAMTSTFS